MCEIIICQTIYILDERAIITGVDVGMFLHVGLLMESFAAVVAGERSRVAVNE